MKYKYKSFLCLFLACMLLVLTACGSGDGDTTASDESPYGTTRYSGGVYADGTDAPETYAQQSNLISVTVPEGYTLVRISWLLEEKGICTSDAFIEAAQNYDLSSNPLLSDVRAAKAATISSMTALGSVFFSNS